MVLSRLYTFGHVCLQAYGGRVLKGDQSQRKGTPIVLQVLLHFHQA